MGIMTDREPVICLMCKKREATVFTPEYMRPAAEKWPDRPWAQRLLAGLPERCKPCDDRLWSS